MIVGVTPDDRKERVAIGDGYRESKESWAELLLDLKRRGLPASPWRGANSILNTGINLPEQVPQSYEKA